MTYPKTPKGKGTRPLWREWCAYRLSGTPRKFMEWCVREGSVNVSCHKYKKDALRSAARRNEENAWLNAKHGTDYPRVQVKGGRSK